MTNADGIMVAAVLLGPIFAVGITLWHQTQNSKRERQLTTFRTLIGTRHIVADPAYSIAINMIPVDFNGDQKVLSAWEKYMEAVYYLPTDENRDRHNAEIRTRQTRLIFEISKTLNYKISESDLETRGYAAQSFVDRDNLGIQSQVAWIRIANALEAQNQAAGLPQGPAPEELIPEIEPPTDRVGEDKS